jgi:CheY-like chemotaxis protein
LRIQVQNRSHPRANLARQESELGQSELKRAFAPAASIVTPIGRNGDGLEITHPAADAGTRIQRSDDQVIFSQIMPVTPGSRRILILDDEASVAETLEMIFRGCGYEVRVALSAEQAIEIIAEWQPDLAIVDVMLPRMNGIQFGTVLKSNYPACHILLMSGHPGTGELLEMAREQGHNFEILAKPLHPALILDIVAHLLPVVKGGSAQA